jgi:hypothetical protein
MSKPNPPSEEYVPRLRRVVMQRIPERGDYASIRT